MNTVNTPPEARLVDWIVYYLKEAKTEKRYVSNNDLAVAITTAFDESDAEDIAQKVLDIINFSKE